MFGGDFLTMYFYIIIGAVSYATSMVLLSWYRHGGAHVKKTLPRYFLALPISLVVSTVLAYGAMWFATLFSIK